MLQVCYSGSQTNKQNQTNLKNPNLNFPFKKIGHRITIWSFDRI